MSESNPWPGDHPIPVAGAILDIGEAILDSGEEILIVRPKHLDQFWLVSGYLEAWESAEDAAIREVQEEVGLVIHRPTIVGSYSCRPIGLNMVFIVYATRVPRESQVTIGDEIAEASWWDALLNWPIDSPATIAVNDYLGRTRSRRQGSPSWPR